jgi:hypothetical protein
MGLVEVPPAGPLVPSTPLRSTAATPEKRRKTLIFTSVGDHSDWMRNFLCPQRDYDIFVAFYGDNTEKRASYAAAADRLFDIKGSKFQNLVRPNGI